MSFMQRIIIERSIKEKRIRFVDMILIDIGGMTAIDSSTLRVITALKDHLRTQHIELLFCQVSSSIHLKFCLAGLGSNSTVHSLEDVLSEIHHSKQTLPTNERMLQVQVASSNGRALEDSGSVSLAFRPLEFLFHNENQSIGVFGNKKRSNSAPSLSNSLR